MALSIARRVLIAAGGIVVALAMAACESVLEVACGPLAASDCEVATRRARELAADRRPGAAVKAIEFTSTDGGYTIEFADGITMGVQGNPGEGEPTASDPPASEP